MMTSKANKLLLFALLLFGFVTPTNYETLDDLKFDRIDIITEEIILFSPNSTTYNKNFIYSEHLVAKEYMTEFALNNSLELEKCKSDDLQIFVVDSEIINDKSRYPSTSNEVSERWAMFDPYVKEQDISAILLTDRGATEVDKVLFGHELAHYWFSIYCWSGSWPSNSEGFAMEFQDYYTLERFGRRYR